MIPAHYTESKMLPATQGRIAFLRLQRNSINQSWIIVRRSRAIHQLGYGPLPVLPGASIIVSELPLSRDDVGKSWQSCLVAEVLDFVCGSSAREPKMLFPTFRCVGKVGIDVSAVEDITSPTRISNAIWWHR